MTILQSIKEPEDIKNLSLKECSQLAQELRDEMITVTAKNGGHLASSLGAVELIIALHRIFDSPKDKFIFDVGHQAYAHKLLTGRQEKFNTLRQHGGLSGFTTREESEHDSFGSGHASNSVSAAVGMAQAADLNRQEYTSIAVIGDGSATGGMAFEAFNNASSQKGRLIVILNDNGMSISNTVGALDKLFANVRFNRGYYKASEKSRNRLYTNKLGRAIWDIGQKFKAAAKGLVMPTVLWEQFGFAYTGPIDGHNIAELEKAFKKVKGYNHKPVLIHVITQKGKGYEPAESDAVHFHGVPPCKNPGTCDDCNCTYSQMFSNTMAEIMRQDERVVAITAAMSEGYAMGELIKEFPERVFDVGICEQHAVTFAAGLATQGIVPVAAIYSTFLQRAYDQIVHDVALQNLPVVFAIDRAGIAGDDGRTHQGAFDVSYLNHIPNMIICSPKDVNELRHLLYTAVNSLCPFAVRFARGKDENPVKIDNMLQELPIGKWEELQKGSHIAIVAHGICVSQALKASTVLEKQGISVSVINARFIKPMDQEMLKQLAAGHQVILVAEENARSGSLGQNILDFLNTAGLLDTVKIDMIALPDNFIEHGAQNLLRRKYGVDSQSIVEKSCLLFNKENTENTREALK
ncbi:MAG: 1-deoxy-D-xylulose-5-phosphate synthase [Chloroflexi bacterium]|nr:1-deoxy-D-xylulose-5-phosphate synthase [Chloroflexota bacterium]